ncbi:carbon-nitrogen hydrolase [Catenovulum sp. SM1970]|uniref:carbon-nitrogen hydrolase n=1 Tax=Marinifaba aquimaris TaxID=2741323 RepID=UPI001572796F|nr:carbon-nitrogen hydrolase [Marinifaba aquimaris]NTS78819.1 carbon-nitrogen hydrolase [Marinifaba aquimaris]
MMNNTFKAACIQQSVANNDKAQNHAHTAQAIRDLANQGVKLVVLQELHSTQYFCQTEDTDVFDFAEPLAGDEAHSVQFFQALAGELDIVLVTSLFEKRAAGVYHNTSVVFDGDKLAGKFRKMHIPDDPGFYEKFYFTPGDNDPDDAFNGFKPIETRLGKIGVLICWDQWYPEAARLMALAGADILCYPTAIGWDINDDKAEQTRQKNAWTMIQQSHAVANGVYVISANRVGWEASPEGNGLGIQFWGGSFIAGPQGEMLAHADDDKEQNLIAEIDIKRSEDVRRIWPYLRDRRVDAYQHINKRLID